MNTEESTAPISSLSSSLEGLKGRWSARLVRMDHFDQLNDLSLDLSRNFSSSGDGKKISPGLGYVGIAATAAWSYATNDSAFAVMRNSIQTFRKSWDAICQAPSTPPIPPILVSLGPGGGEKDTAILKSLAQRTADYYYVPVDLSADMLTFTTSKVAEIVPNDRLIEVHLDFSKRSHLEDLRSYLSSMFAGTPILFSLLGNTIANFGDDRHALELISRSLLKTDDLLLLEVATSPDLEASTAQAAADEYRGSRAFEEFLTSTLTQYTNLTVDGTSVQFLLDVEEDRSVVIKAVYTNAGQEDLFITTPLKRRVCFPPDDTILLMITRKYADAGLRALLAAGSLTEISHTDVCFEPSGRIRDFGMKLLLLRRTDGAGAHSIDHEQSSSLARSLWVANGA